MNHTFELGPIRPPSEATSILIRVTRNCPWNQCAFCHTYKGEIFSKRSVKEVKKDIDAIHALYARIAGAVKSADYDGVMKGLVLPSMGLDIAEEPCYRQVAYWYQCGMKSAFLQDGNSLMLKTSELVEIITYLKEKFPTVGRITTYARAKTVSKKSAEELRELREAGLTRLHIGMESGSDEVLLLVKKGVTAEEQIGAGRKAVEAGFDLSEYFMPGLGGRELSEKNAIESARVVNAVNPTFIRVRSAVPIPGTPLYRLMEEGIWTPLTEEEKVRELRLFLERLEGITSRFLSDHMMNLLEDVEGKLPGDREGMLGLIDRFLGMDREDRESFILGRRLGQFRFLEDYRRDPGIEEVKGRLKGAYGSVDKAVLEILKNFI